VFRQKRTRGEQAFNVFNHILLLGIALLCLLPYITIISKSISDNAYVVSGQIGLWPKGFHLNAYQVLLSGSNFRTAFMNSVYITVLGTLLTVFFTAVVGYAAAKQDLPGRKAINLLYIFTMLFNGGIIPTYLVIKETGLINNLFVLFIPSLVTAFNLIVVRSYFESLPPALEESARIDGAGNLRILFKIILPISLPSLATIAIFSAVGIWNNYMGPLMYLTKKDVQVLPLFLQNIVSSADGANMESTAGMDAIASETFRAAAIVVSTLPILMIYPFLQRFFVQGMTLGAVKQ
jgi:putative aldouronate transport system permease protein